MGSSSSVTEVKTRPADQHSTASQDSLGSLSSGFHSSASASSKLAEMAQTKKPNLTKRISIVVQQMEFLEEEEVQKLEDKIVKQTPALKAVLQCFGDCTQTLAVEANRREDFSKTLCKLLDTKVKKPFDTYTSDQQRIVMANKLAKIDFVKHVTDYYDFIIEELDIEAVTGSFVEETNDQGDPAFKLILTIRMILWNFSDSSHRFSEELAGTGIVERLVHDLEAIYDDEGLEQMEEEGQDLFAFSSAVGILHNCARNSDVDKENFRQLGAVEKLLPFLQSNLVYVKMITLLALGNIIKEDQVTDLRAGLDVFAFLIDAIRKALNSKDRKEHGFHLSELVDGLASLAQSDENKKLIMMKNPLDMMTSILGSKNHVEVLAAIKLVWELAFLDENKQIILKNAKLTQILSELSRNRDNQEIRNAALGAWFTISAKDERIGVDEKIKSMRAPAPDVVSADEPKGKFLMFSYCWGDKEMVYKIYKILLDEGYPIWLDVNEMEKYGNVLEGMARAVEESAVVLIFYSEKYKNSQNCRTEADYAYCLQKPIVPIKLQRGYTPDGWLGALIGAKLFIEFSPKYDFNFKMQELRNRLPKFNNKRRQSQGGSPPPTPRQGPGQVPGQTPKPPSTPPAPVFPIVSGQKKLTEWQRTDIEKWAKDNKLSAGKVKNLSAENLQFLYSVMSRAPETFYRWLEDKLQLKSLDDLMRFDAAMRQLQPFV